MTRLEWVAVATTTGQQLAFLPDLTPQGPLVRTLGRPDSLTVTLPLATAPPNWQEATKPYGACLVALVDDNPVYGCIVVEQTTQWSADPAASSVSLACATLESYLDRRFVGDQTYTAKPQNALVADVIARFIAAGNGTLPGVPMTVAGGVGGKARDRTYLDVDDRTVLSVLEDLSEVIDGPEWTIEWKRTDGARPTFTPVLLVGARIGRDLRNVGLAPPAFDLPGCVLTAQRVNSYAAGKGANVATATGEKNGDDRAQVTAFDTTDLTRPLTELRGSVSTTNGDTESLAQHAQGALAVTARGGVTITLTAAVHDAPVLGVDWALGDTIAVSLSTPDGGNQGRYSGYHRCIGWQWQVGTTDNPVETVSPVLFVPEASL